MGTDTYVVSRMYADELGIEVKEVTDNKFKFKARFRDLPKDESNPWVYFGVEGYNDYHQIMNNDSYIEAKMAQLKYLTNHKNQINKDLKKKKLSPTLLSWLLLW